jgi:hypothetical protein
VRQLHFEREQKLDLDPLSLYRLAIAGNCRWVNLPEPRSRVDMCSRMCLVEVERSPKPVASWYVAIEFRDHRYLRREVILQCNASNAGSQSLYKYTNDP